MSNQYMDKEPFLAEVKESLSSAREASQNLVRLITSLEQVLKNDVTFSSIDELRLCIEGNAVSKNELLRLEKSMKRRANSRLNGK